MCDYSLHAQMTRPAVKGERLRTHRFSMGCTGGFAPADDKSETPVAVCVRPGTELAFDKPVTSGSYFGMFPKRYQRQAVFAQHNVESLCVHHDTLEFPDGTNLLLHYCCPDQYATVLQVPAEEAKDAPEARNIEAALEETLEHT